MVSEDVSIHAPVWVRHISIGALPEHKMFQFTHPCGCDLFRGQPRAVSDSFNSRTRVGATPPSGRSTWSPLFQFTHPCGCDCITGHPLTSFDCFNSRTRVGATASPLPQAGRGRVSIHAPVWVRPYCSLRIFLYSCFNSRTRVGATCQSDALLRRYPVSIHAPVWVRPATVKDAANAVQFQFTHPCGCDFNATWRTMEGFRFQFTHPCGCDVHEKVERRQEAVSIHAPVWVRLDYVGILRDSGSFNSRTRVGATL